MILNRPIVYLFSLIFAFLLCLNLLLPPISDDFDAYFAAQKGFESAKYFYFHWNARIGELLHKGFIGGFNPFLFDFINAIVGSGFIFAFFILLFGRIPKDRNDITTIMFICLLILVASPFGAVFLWGSGALNYLWGLFFIIIFLLPYRIFSEKALNRGGGTTRILI
ncbi:hypothetical protein CCY99_07760 [Helicobacter sp. 16-1353]|uniref:DUF6056 family protein n=1 Tax=Helicobacter sp. 16-1353 TaxID=2004996 RepID=UPI000DCD9EE2|nr:DUF6056 family protein [Helicobacter sp. 16-1353]RAX52038.1 hypothetical protein CCY99_07760 [Helicobacter sp. 16-1353]